VPEYDRPVYAVVRAALAAVAAAGDFLVYSLTGADPDCAAGGGGAAPPQTAAGVRVLWDEGPRAVTLVLYGGNALPIKARACPACAAAANASAACRRGGNVTRLDLTAAIGAISAPPAAALRLRLAARPDSVRLRDALCAAVWGAVDARCRWRLWVDLANATTTSAGGSSTVVTVATATVLLRSNADAAAARRRLLAAAAAPAFPAAFFPDPAGPPAQANVTAPGPVPKLDRDSAAACGSHYDCAAGLYCAARAGPGGEAGPGYGSCDPCRYCLVDAEDAVDGLCPQVGGVSGFVRGDCGNLAMYTLVYRV
jgi:hypothetical protein